MQKRREFIEKIGKTAFGSLLLTALPLSKATAKAKDAPSSNKQTLKLRIHPNAVKRNK